MQKTFECQNCKNLVKTVGNIGTKNRNHCPKCLYSKHVDEKTPGARKSSCKALMKPVGLTFKKSHKDKYGKEKQGELMIVHRCLKCEKISINRAAGDDNADEILKIYNESLLKKEKINNNIKLLTEKDKEEIKAQLYGY